MAGGGGGRKRREEFEGGKRRIVRGAEVARVIEAHRNGDRDSVYLGVLV